MFQSFLVVTASTKSDSVTFFLGEGRGQQRKGQREEVIAVKHRFFFGKGAAFGHIVVNEGRERQQGKHFAADDLFFIEIFAKGQQVKKSCDPTAASGQETPEFLDLSFGKIGKRIYFIV